MVAYQAHNLMVVGSSPTPATIEMSVWTSIQITYLQVCSLRRCRNKIQRIFFFEKGLIVGSRTSVTLRDVMVLYTVPFANSQNQLKESIEADEL